MIDGKGAGTDIIYLSGYTAPDLRFSPFGARRRPRVIRKDITQGESEIDLFFLVIQAEVIERYIYQHPEERFRPHDRWRRAE